MRILLADQELRIRKTMRLLLARLPGHELVAELTRADEVAACAASTHPDMIMIDLDLPGLSVQPLLEQLREAIPGVIIVGLSGHTDPKHYGGLALLDEFIPKNEPANRILNLLGKYRSSKPTLHTYEQH